LPVFGREQKEAVSSEVTREFLGLHFDVLQSDGDALHSDKFGCGRDIALDFQTQLNGLANALDELVQRAGLRVATSQFRDARHIITFSIALDDDAELTLARFSHRYSMPEFDRRRKPGEATAVLDKWSKQISETIKRQVRA